MTCEVCGEATSGNLSDVPEDDDRYFKMVQYDESVPEGAHNKIEYAFCSLDCLNVFAADIGGESDG